MTYAERLAAKGKRRVGWALPIELVDWVEDQAAENVLGPARFVELVLERAREQGL